MIRGQVEYSDQYRKGAEVVNIAPLSTIQMPKMDLSTPTAEQAAEPVVTPYTKLAITYPEPNGSFHSGNGEVTVTVVVAPELLLRIPCDCRWMESLSVSANKLLFDSKC